jgi:hypothetical protein
MGNNSSKSDERASIQAAEKIDRQSYIVGGQLGRVKNALKVNMPETLDEVVKAETSIMTVESLASYLSREVILPVLTSESSISQATDMLKAGVSDKTVDSIRAELYTSLQDALPAIKKKSMEPIRQYMCKDTNPNYGDLQWLVSSNAAWWILQPWSVDAYTVPLVTSYLREDWVYDTTSKIAAENLHPWQTKACVESILWYALIGIRANDTSRNARQSVISALLASQRRHTKQQKYAMRK